MIPRRLESFFYICEKGGTVMLETVKQLKVTPEHLDDQDHVNNVVFISLLEKARLEWYDKVGLTKEERRKRKIGTVVRKLEVNYIKEARLGDTLIIRTRPLRLGNTSFTFQQTIYNERDERLVESIVTTVMFDTEKRKSITVIDEIAAHFK